MTFSQPVFAFSFHPLVERCGLGRPMRRSTGTPPSGPQGSLRPCVVIAKTSERK